MPLSRVLEPEVMDSLDEALDYDAMDHSEVNRRFVADLLAEGEIVGDVLDLGAGTARIPIELCQACATCRVVAIDLATHMLDVARNNIEFARLTDRIRLNRADAKQLPYDDGQFAAVISNSIIHHVPEPVQVFREAMRATAPGGRLFFRDLLRPASEEQVISLVQSYAGQENEHSRQMFEASLRAALSLEEASSLVTALGFDPQSVQVTSDRHWTWSARRKGL